MSASVSLPIDGNRAVRCAVAVTIRCMSLARAWTRQLYGASGAALLVPGAIVLALVLLGLAGGFGQLGTLSQAFAGPAVPGGSTSVGGVVSAGAATPVLPIARGGAPAPLLAAARAGAGAGTGLGTGAGGPRAGTGPLRGSGSTGPGTGSTGPGPGRGSGPTAGGGAGTGGGGGQPTLIDHVIELGTSVTKQVPGPAGGLATQLLQSVGKSVDSALAPSSRSSSALAGTVTTLVAPLRLP
jgi:hypothetical protein